MLRGPKVENLANLARTECPTAPRQPKWPPRSTRKGELCCPVALRVRSNEKEISHARVSWQIH